MKSVSLTGFNKALRSSLIALLSNNECIKKHKVQKKIVTFVNFDYRAEVSENIETLIIVTNCFSHLLRPLSRAVPLRFCNFEL